MLLPSGGVHTGEATLLMRAEDVLRVAQSADARLRPRSTCCFRSRVVEKTEEFDIGRYRILEQLD